ncbi:MAG: sulfite exporter TauE/SafE family protein [Saprospiraceae bacterium]|nr:sulfite exporter TauE/SafE family protein [Saprospiraceae bacterium]
MIEHPEVLFFFFGIALLYSSVGFGGGSSYLAILALYGFEYDFLRFSALACNIIVVLGGTWILYREGHLKWKKMWPIILASVPMAFLGGRIRIAEEAFFVLLGFTLLVAGLMIFVRKRDTPRSEVSSVGKRRLLNGTMGGGIGLLSGMVGIGGGIFLSPVLHLLHWDTAKKIAATCSAFILVNSIAGISGLLSRGTFGLDWKMISLLLLCVLVGGQIGSRIGAHKLSPLLVRRLTAVLIIFVSVRILWEYLG